MRVVDSDTVPFSYAILRAVPDVERGECLNVGVVLFCRQRGYLGVRVTLDEPRLRALAPGVAIAELREHLAGLVRVAQGEPEAGPVAGTQLPCWWRSMPNSCQPR